MATAIETAPVVLLPYTDTLAEACLTLLSVESRPLQPRRSAAFTPQSEVVPSTKVEEDDESSSDQETEDEEQSPLGKDGKPKKPEETPNVLAPDPKHPSLRRGALVFLGMLFRTASNLSSDETDRASNSSPTLGVLRLPGQSADVRSTSKSLVGLETKVRARTVLRYLEQTDEDSLVRHQAGEVLEEIH